MVDVHSGIEHCDADTGAIQSYVAALVYWTTSQICAGGAHDMAHRTHVAVQRNIGNVAAAGEVYGSLCGQRSDTYREVSELAYVASA